MTVEPFLAIGDKLPSTTLISKLPKGVYDENKCDRLVMWLDASELMIQGAKFNKILRALKDLTFCAREQCGIGFWDG